MLGEATSTVAGRFRITGLAAVAPKASSTASQISSANSCSVPEKASGEYSKVQSVSGCAAASSRITFAASVARRIVAGLSCRNTTRRNTGAVAL